MENKKSEWFTAELKVKYWETNDRAEMEKILRIASEVLEGLIMKSNYDTCLSYDCVQLSIKRCSE